MDRFTALIEYPLYPATNNEQRTEEQIKFWPGGPRQWQSGEREIASMAGPGGGGGEVVPISTVPGCSSTNNTTNVFSGPSHPILCKLPIVATVDPLIQPKVQVLRAKMFQLSSDLMAQFPRSQLQWHCSRQAAGAGWATGGSGGKINCRQRGVTTVKYIKTFVKCEHVNFPRKLAAKLSNTLVAPEFGAAILKEAGLLVELWMGWLKCIGWQQQQQQPPTRFHCPTILIHL